MIDFVVVKDMSVFANLFLSSICDRNLFMEFLMHSVFFFQLRACYMSEEKSGGSQKLRTYVWKNKIRTSSTGKRNCLAVT